MKNFSWRSFCRNYGYSVGLIFFSFALYYSHIQKKEIKIQQLQSQLQQLNQQQEQCRCYKEELSQIIDCRSDPNWIEKVLMKKLRFASKNRIKVRLLSQEEQIIFQSKR